MSFIMGTIRFIHKFRINFSLQFCCCCCCLFVLLLSWLILFIHGGMMSLTQTMTGFCLNFFFFIFWLKDFFFFNLLLFFYIDLQIRVVRLKTYVNQIYNNVYFGLICFMVKLRETNLNFFFLLLS